MHPILYYFSERQNVTKTFQNDFFNETILPLESRFVFPKRWHLLKIFGDVYYCNGMQQMLELCYTTCFC